MHGMYYGYSLRVIRKKEQNHLKNKLNCQGTISPELIVSSIDNSNPIRNKQDKINYIETQVINEVKNKIAAQAIQVTQSFLVKELNDSVQLGNINLSINEIETSLKNNSNFI